jgi:teichuronic acid biosynthesis glycosyltransferase TuaG
MAAHRSPFDPTVSVVMPVCDCESLVATSIRSVLGQTYADWELLVVDDYSLDRSADVVEEFCRADSRVRLLRNHGLRGAAHSRNLAIRSARGRYIAFLDSDDQWLPRKLEKQLRLARRTRAPLTFTSYYKIDGDSTETADTFVPNGRVVRAPLVLEYRHLLRQNYIGCLTAMYDIAQVGRVLMPEISRRQDYALWLEILRRPGRRAVGLAEPLALYRAQRPGSLSSNKIRGASYNWQVYRDVEQLPLPVAAAAFGSYAVRASRKFLI